MWNSQPSPPPDPSRLIPKWSPREQNGHCLSAMMFRSRPGLTWKTASFPADKHAVHTGLTLEAATECGEQEELKHTSSHLYPEQEIPHCWEHFFSTPLIFLSIKMENNLKCCRNSFWTPQGLLWSVVSGHWQHPSMPLVFETTDGYVRTSHLVLRPNYKFRYKIKYWD